MLYPAYSSAPLRLDALPEKEDQDMKDVVEFPAKRPGSPKIAQPLKKPLLSEPEPCDSMIKDDDNEKEHPGNSYETLPDQAFSVVADSESSDADVEYRLNDDYLDCPWPICAGPALQVINVAMCTTNKLPAEIYGEITINDYKRVKYYIFQRKEPQLIKHTGWTDLPLTRCPIAPVMGGALTLQLTDVHGNRVFNHVYDTEEATWDSEKETFLLEGEGNYGFRFRMLFTTIPFAVMARIQMLLCATPCTEDQIFHVHGKIIANKVLCFEMEEDEAEIMKYRKPNELRLLRYVVAVPVNSPLNVDVDLYSGSLEISKTRHVIDTWPHTVRLPSEYTFLCEPVGYMFGVDVHWTCHENFFTYDPQLMADPFYPTLPKIMGTLTSNALVEIFSVYVGGGNPSAPRDIDLYGTVMVSDRGDDINIFDSAKDGPHKLHSYSLNEEEQFRTLSLEFPDNWWIRGKYFRMLLKLKDGQEKLVCRGHIGWIPDVDARYDRRLCDVIEGENGYFAAVHYSVFEKGKKAEVSVKCSELFPCYSIYGSISTEYDNYDYTSTYDQQCYRSIIFKRSKENPLEVKGCKVPILKGQVVAPLACKELTVFVDLWVSPEKNCPPYHVRTQFSSDTGSESDRGLCVNVKWLS